MGCASVTSLFPDGFSVSKQQSLIPITIRGFGGGLNKVDNDIEMEANFQVALNNFVRTPKGSQVVRYGSNWFDDVDTVASGTIVDETYFSNAIISVMTSGEVVATDGDGVSTVIWNDAIAALLLGSPDGWSSGLDSIDFVPFKNKLVIHNGVDKPIVFTSALVANYLQDEATGSNTNVPIGKYGCVVGNYHCIAGIPAAPTTVYVTAKGTIGTFPGDPAPNDSISIDVGAYAPEGAPEIRGIAGFRTFLIVFFEKQALLIKLGVYDEDDNHIPSFDDTMPAFGLLGHRCIIQVEADLVFASPSGICSAKRNLFSGLVESSPLSSNVEPLYRSLVGVLTEEQLLKSCFMIYNETSHETKLHLPSGNGFVRMFNEKLRYDSWSTFSGPAWVSGCVSSKGRVFQSIGSRIFQLGNGIFTGENYRADRLNDRDDDWNTGTSYDIGDIARDIDNDTSYICIGAHISGGTTFEDDRTDQAVDPKWEEYLGEAIDIELELPWLDGKNPRQLKSLRYASVATKGTAQFTLSVWVDNLYKDDDGTIIHSPALSLLFIGNDAPGFGFDAGPYGGGRRSNDPRNYRFPVSFKTLKAKITGSVREHLEISGMTFLFLRGKYQRA
jgi:hypothetical protein